MQSTNAKKEEVHGIYDHIYKGSGKVNFKSYFNEYRRLIRNSEFYTDDEYDPSAISSFISATKITQEDYEALGEHCSIDNMTVPGEMDKVTKTTFEFFKEPVDSSVLDGVQLETIAETKKRSVLKQYQKIMKYKSEKPVVR